MYLPPKVAASLTVTIVALGALLVGLLHSSQMKMPTWIVVYQAGGLMLMAGAIALPVALPNLAAAFAANRFAASGSPLVYIGVFAAVFFALWIAEMNFITRFIGAGSFSFRDITGKFFPAYLALNLAVCIGAAWWYGQKLSG